MLLALLAAFVLRAPGSSEVVLTASLGIVRGRTLCVYVERLPWPNSPGAAEYTASFEARTAQGRLVRRRDFDLGAGGASLLQAEVVGAVHNGRRQLFVSGDLGLEWTYLLDFDGLRVRQLYHLNEGHVSVVLNWVLDPPRILEYYDRWQFDGPDMGLGREVAPGLVERTLVWRKSRFVPLHPGATKIVPGPGRGRRPKTRRAF